MLNLCTCDADAAKFPSPLYLAVSECEPTARDVVGKLAKPLLTGTAPDICVLPSKNVTVPEATCGVMSATNVNGVPKIKAVVFTESSNSTSVGAFATF